MMDTYDPAIDFRCGFKLWVAFLAAALLLALLVPRIALIVLGFGSLAGAEHVFRVRVRSGSPRWRLISFGTLSLMALVFLAAFMWVGSATAGSPGVGTTPAMTCVKTTIKANGHTTDSTVAATSGNAASDRYALKLVRAFNIARERGKTYEPQTGYALVETYESGAFGMSLIELKGQLLGSCSLPAEAAAGD